MPEKARQVSSFIFVWRPLGGVNVAFEEMIVMMRRERLLKTVSAVRDFGEAIRAWILLTGRSPWKLENLKQVLVEVTSCFKTPCPDRLSTNATNIGLTPNFTGSLMVPKLVWSNRKRGHLTFTEMLEGPYGWTVLPQYDDGETRLMANSPQEIRAAVDEMIRATEHDCSCPTPTSDQEAFDRRRERFKSTSQMRVADSFPKAHRALVN